METKEPIDFKNITEDELFELEKKIACDISDLFSSQIIYKKINNIVLEEIVVMSLFMFLSGVAKYADFSAERMLVAFHTIVLEDDSLNIKKGYLNNIDKEVCFKS